MTAVLTPVTARPAGRSRLSPRSVALDGFGVTLAAVFARSTVRLGGGSEVLFSSLRGGQRLTGSGR